MNRNELIQKDCIEKAIECLGTSYVFNRKISKLNRPMKLVTILGLLVPILVGSIALGFGTNTQILNLIITIAIPLGIFQIALSLLSLIFEWDNRLKYAYESMTDNRKISEQFIELSAQISINGSVPNEHEKYKMRYEYRKERDDMVDFSEKEDRMGMRYALRQLQKTCATCKLVPSSMKATKCDTCGNF